MKRAIISNVKQLVTWISIAEVIFVIEIILFNILISLNIYKTGAGAISNYICLALLHIFLIANNVGIQLEYKKLIKRNKATYSFKIKVRLMLNTVSFTIIGFIITVVFRFIAKS